MPPFLYIPPKEREGDLPLYPFSNRGAAGKDQRCPLKYITAPIIFRAGKQGSRKMLTKKSVYSYVAPMFALMFALTFALMFAPKKNKENRGAGEQSKGPMEQSSRKAIEQRTNGAGSRKNV